MCTNSVLSIKELLPVPEQFAPMIRLCRRRGYEAQDWGRGMNTGPGGDVDAWLHELSAGWVWSLVVPVGRETLPELPLGQALVVCAQSVPGQVLVEDSH